MAGRCQFILTDDTGRRLVDSTGRFPLSTVLGGEFLRVSNTVGQFWARFAVTFATNLIRPDRMVQLWYAPEGGAMRKFRTYLIRKGRLWYENSDLIIELVGPDVNDLLRRRQVINYAGTDGADKTDYADDMMKEIVDEQFVTDGSDPAPDYGSRVMPNFTVEAALSQGPSITKAFAWRNALQVIADIQRASREEGTEVFWDVADIVSGNSIAFEFRTRINQPGADLTGSNLVFDEAAGNLANARIEHDWGSEFNYVYVGGQGVEEFRNIQQVYDANRIAISQYGRVEAFQYAAHTPDPNAELAAGYNRLEEGRPGKWFTGLALDTERSRFGRDWMWGDRVPARFLGTLYEAVIRKVAIRIDAEQKVNVVGYLEVEDV